MSLYEFGHGPTQAGEARRTELHDAALDIARGNLDLPAHEIAGMVFRKVSRTDAWRDFRDLSAREALEHLAIDAHAEAQNERQQD